jgi:hypothetical protein
MAAGTLQFQAVRVRARTEYLQCKLTCLVHSLHDELDLSKLLVILISVFRFFLTILEAVRSSFFPFFTSSNTLSHSRKRDTEIDKLFYSGLL